MNIPSTDESPFGCDAVVRLGTDAENAELLSAIESRLRAGAQGGVALHQVSGILEPGGLLDFSRSELGMMALSVARSYIQSERLLNSVQDQLAQIEADLRPHQDGWTVLVKSGCATATFNGEDKCGCFSWMDECDGHLCPRCEEFVCVFCSPSMTGLCETCIADDWTDGPDSEAARAARNARRHDIETRTLRIAEKTEIKVRETVRDTLLFMAKAQPECCVMQLEQAAEHIDDVLKDMFAPKLVDPPACSSCKDEAPFGCEDCPDAADLATKLAQDPQAMTRFNHHDPRERPVPSDAEPTIARRFDDAGAPAPTDPPTETP